MTKIDNQQVKILIVDDTPTNLEVASATLGKENYDIYLADDGVTALNEIEKTNFDLILLDIMMPKLDGFETYKMMKRSKKFEDVPVIFLTAKADIDSVLTGFELGAVDYIRKPFNSAELKVRIKNHIELKKIREELELKNKDLQKAYKDLQKAYNDMHILAITDPLTNIFNRRELINRLEMQITSYERNKNTFSVIIMDIDFFKNINDTYGHVFGDYILESVADILKSNVRKQDSVSRWGGEEFLILLPDTNEKGAALLAEKIRSKIKNNIFNNGKFESHITITLGVKAYDQVQTLDSLISKADDALYEGKRNGRNCVVMYNEINNNET